MSAASKKFAELLNLARVIPVLTIERSEDAVPLAKALVAGGVRVLEVTLRTPVAIDAGPKMAGDSFLNGGAIDRAREVLAWSPQVSLRDGLAAQIAWHREQQ